MCDAVWWSRSGNWSALNLWLTEKEKKIGFSHGHLLKQFTTPFHLLVNLSTEAAHLKAVPRLRSTQGREEECKGGVLGMGELFAQLWWLTSLCCVCARAAVGASCARHSKVQAQCLWTHTVSFLLSCLALLSSWISLQLGLKISSHLLNWADVWKNWE